MPFGAARRSAGRVDRALAARARAGAARAAAAARRRPLQRRPRGRRDAARPLPVEQRRPGVGRRARPGHRRRHARRRRPSWPASWARSTCSGARAAAGERRSPTTRAGRSTTSSTAWCIAKLQQAEHRAVRAGRRRRVPAPRLPRHDRHAADRRRSPRASWPTRGRTAAQRLVDELLAAARVRRLLGAEVGRPAARRSAGAGAQGGLRLSTAGFATASPRTSRSTSSPASSSRPKARSPKSPAGHFYQVVNEAGRDGQHASRRCSSACASPAPSATIIRSTAGARTDYYGMTAFFAPAVGARTSPRGEMLLATGDPATKHPRTGETVHAHALGTTDAGRESPPGDRRAALAAWLTAPDNPWFARNLANRVWAHFLGRGLVEPVDDVRATNPPTQPRAARRPGRSTSSSSKLRPAGLDPHDHRLARPISARQPAERDERARRAELLAGPVQAASPAEVLLDTVCQTTGVPEKFDGVPAGYAGDPAVGQQGAALLPEAVRPAACGRRPASASGAPSRASPRCCTC